VRQTSKVSKNALSLSAASISLEEEKLLEGGHLVIQCSLNEISSHALVDCGATGFSFIDENFARQHGWDLIPLHEPRVLEVIDGRRISSGTITHVVKLPFSIGDHSEVLIAFVTNLGHYPLVLGIPWLRHHDVSIRFSTNTITFDSPACMGHRQEPVIVKGIEDIESLISSHKESPVPLPLPLPPPLPQPVPPLPPLPLSRPVPPLPLPLPQPVPLPPPPSPPTSPPTPKTPIAIISAASFSRLAKNKNQRYGPVHVFSLSLYEINKALERKTIESGDLASMVPPEFHEFLPLFDKIVADRLPPHRAYDHKIVLKDGFEPPFGPLYSLSRPELEALKAFLEENLDKHFIRQSSSPSGAPVLFVKKGDGSLRLVVDYRGLNEGTIKNRYPLPLIRETLMRLSKAQWFTKLDVRGAYNLIRMGEGEEWKTAFRTRYGLFESLVMPFGLTNAPADFQRFINDVLAPFLDRFTTAYLDDILIYSNSLEEHREHVRQVLEKLSAAGLHLKPEKCEFYRREVKYLGLIVGIDGIKMDPDKVAAVSEWAVPRKVKDVRSFLGFANFYRRFVRGYSELVRPLTRLTRKEIKFRWGPEEQAAFTALKIAFTTAPVLRRFDHDRDVIVETDASDYVSAGVLSQYDNDGILHPVAFFSKKHSPAECNYEIYDKELMAIVRAFEEWRPELQSVENPIQVLSDHKNLEYFTTTKLLNRRQARWSQFLSQFDFRIVYRPGKSGGKPDALTRRSGDLPKEGDNDDARTTENLSIVIKPHQLVSTLNAMHLLANDNASPPPDQPIDTASPPPDPPIDNGLLAAELDRLFNEAYEADPLPNDVLRMLRDGVRQSRRITLAECREQAERLWYRDRLYVPDHEPLRLHLLQNHHEVPVAGHPGRSKTLELLQRQYYWPTMRKDTEQFVRNCHVCQRSRSGRHAPFGILRPLPIPDRPWQDISMDFVTGLPESGKEKYDTIWVVVDRLTKDRHFVPCHTTVDAEALADLYIQHIFRLHGLPRTIVSDRGPQFAADFWEHLCRRLGIDRRLSTAFHPQTDGQTERINAVMEQYLRAHVSYLQDDWADWLSLAEFSANNQASESTGVSPFFGLYGYDPQCQFDLSPALPNNADDQRARATAVTLSDIHDHLRSEIGRAQLRYQEYADNRRLPAPDFRVGDLVWLDARNWKTKRPAHKLDNKRHGPFKISEVISPYAYRLELSEGMRIHPVFHVSLLESAANDPYPGQRQPPPLPVEIDGEPEWYADAILDSRIFGRQRELQYLVKWTGYDQPKWEPATLVNGLEVIDRFHERYPDKPGPLPEDPE
jgi:transposase InsO family protein